MPEADLNTLKDHIAATSDERTVNNTMRHQYRILSGTEKEQMQRLKDKGLDFLLYLHVVGGTVAADGTVPFDARQSSRELSIAQTKIEEAVMWAVKHLTR